MAGEEQPQKSLLEIVQNEAKKAKRDAVRASVKAKYADLIKAQQVVADIQDAIIADLLSVGENEAEIRAILSGE